MRRRVMPSLLIAAFVLTGIGMAAERIALRWFSQVYGVSVNTPARYTELGVQLVGRRSRIAGAASATSAGTSSMRGGRRTV